MADVDDKLNWFWKNAGLSSLGDAFQDMLGAALGTGSKLDAIQKKVIKGVWEGLSEGIGSVEDKLKTAGVNVLAQYDIPKLEAERMMDAVFAAIPDIPLVKQVLVVGSYVYFMFSTLTKGMASSGELIDKHFRRIILPGTGSYPDYLTATWRGLDIEGLNDLQNETGLAIPWRQVLQHASQWWPDIPFIQEARRRGMYSDEEYKAALLTNGVIDWRFTPMLEKMTWNVPPIQTVLELYRRSGMDKGQIEPLLQAAGFTEENADYMLSFARRLIEEPTLFEMKRRGIFTDAEYLKRLSVFGYDDNDLSKVAEMYRILPDIFQLKQMYFRGLIDKGQYLKWLERLGYNKQDAGHLEESGWYLPGPADLMRFGVREVFTPSIARKFGQYQQFPSGITEWAKKIGITKEVAEMYWAAHWELPAVGQMYDMFHRGIITRTDLKMGVRARDVMPYWQDKVIALSYRLIPRRTLPRMVKQGLLGTTALISRFSKLGYSAEDSAIMARSAQIQSVEESKTLTRSDIINAMRYGWYSSSKARNALEGLGYGAEAVGYYLADGERRKDLEEARQGAVDISKVTDEAVDLTTAEIVRGYSQGMIDQDKASDLLTGLGVATSAITFKLSLSDLRRSINHKEQAAKQYKRMFDKHLLTTTQTQTNLIAVGYITAEVDLLVAEWSLERTADDAIDNIKDRLPTISDLEKWLKLGIVSVDQWVAYMKEHSFTDSVIGMHLEEILLTQEID